MEQINSVSLSEWKWHWRRMGCGWRGCDSELHKYCQCHIEYGRKFDDSHKVYWSSGYITLTKNRKINSGTYPFEHSDFSLSFICLWMLVDFFSLFRFTSKLVYTSCYLICVVYHSVQYLFVPFAYVCNGSHSYTGGSLRFVNTIVVFLFCMALIQLDSKTSHLILVDQFRFHIFTFANQNQTKTQKILQWPTTKFL